MSLKNGPKKRGLCLPLYWSPVRSSTQPILARSRSLASCAVRNASFRSFSSRSRRRSYSSSVSFARGLRATDVSTSEVVLAVPALSSSFFLRFASRFSSFLFLFLSFRFLSSSSELDDAVLGVLLRFLSLLPLPLPL